MFTCLQEFWGVWLRINTFTTRATLRYIIHVPAESSHPRPELRIVAFAERAPPRPAPSSGPNGFCEAPRPPSDGAEVLPVHAPQNDLSSESKPRQPGGRVQAGVRTRCRCEFFVNAASATWHGGFSCGLFDSFQCCRSFWEGT